jgi:hypothetical protein
MGDPIIGEMRRPFPAVLGWWDKSSPGTTIGTLLIFIVECSLVSLLSNSDRVDIAINASSHGIFSLPDGEFVVLEDGEITDSALSILNGVDNVNNVYLCGGRSGFQALKNFLSETHLSWPQENRLALTSVYDTTQYVQALWRATGRIMPLQLRDHIRIWARECIQRKFGGVPVVGLHLKKVLGYQGHDSISLANESAWFDFLVAVEVQSDIQFILLGDDSVSGSIQALPNITLARNIGADNFCKHLALLSECSGFMGMMSAISNMALFSDIPFTIFKNPDHHREEMLLEMGVDDRYPFSTPYQKVIRETESSFRLLTELGKMPFARKVSINL